MNDEPNNGHADDLVIAAPADATDAAVDLDASQLLVTPTRRYLMKFFYQWEHRANGDVLMHVYPGQVIQGQPVLQGEPIVLWFEAAGDGPKMLAADVERGFRSPAVQVATADQLPGGAVPLNREQRRKHGRR